jgi:hypothetical protein
MTSLRAILQQDWTGELLFAVQGYCSPEGLPRAVSMQLGQRWLTLLGDLEEPLLRILPGVFSPSADSPLAAVDWASRDPFARFLHCPLYSWWLLENEMGGEDGLFLAFDSQNGFLVLAQPAGLEVLAVSRVK